MTYKIMVNGVVRDMTPEEIAEHEKMCAEMEAKQTNAEPTQLDRVEAQVLYTALMTDTLIEEV